MEDQVFENLDFGQEVIRENEWEIVVRCPVCGDELNVRSPFARIDEHGNYVHSYCLGVFG